MLRTWIVTGAVLVASAGFQAPVEAQRVDATRVIDLHVNAEADNRSIGGAVMEGKGFRITFNGVGTFEIVPVVVDEARGTFSVTVYQGPVGAETDGLRAVETVSAQRGVPVALRSMPSVGLVIEGIRRAVAQAGAASFTFTARTSVRIASASMVNRCCVTCGRVTACACAVSGDCGSCCSGPCCPPVEPTSTDRVLPAERAFARMAAPCGTPIRAQERIHTSAARPEAVVAIR
jgi:hypothetical protein